MSQVNLYEKLLKKYSSQINPIQAQWKNLKRKPRTSPMMVTRRCSKIKSEKPMVKCLKKIIQVQKRRYLSVKRPSKKRPSKKRSTKRRSMKKRSTKRRSMKKRSTKRRSMKKRSTKRRSMKKRSTKK
jgi:hypothetical protein